MAEIDADAYVMRHQKSGARLLYLASKDDNKVFSISFYTPPSDDTGLPHILEHSVLCGSRKYPLKEPFVELVKGSLNTFVNAMTFPDKTMYPVASRNGKDFRNLMDVYLDAVFYPDIYRNKYIFQQEGWHYELLSPDLPLEYKGVVYNEMKGVFSSPEAILEQQAMKALFPASPYGFESGGSPDSIPQLGWEEFTRFHRTFYHPSNSYIFLYGDLAIEETLDFLDREYLSAFGRIPAAPPPAKQAMPARTAKMEGFYPLAKDESAKNKTFLAWYAVVGDALNAEQNLALQLLEHYLLETAASPLKKALIDAGVGKEVSGSFSRSILQPVFSVKAAGARTEDQNKFVGTIYRTLQNISIEGIDKELLAASLNIMEFNLREADFGVYPKGLIYAINCMDSWLYGASPLLYLAYDRLLGGLRDKLSTRYYESLIENCLLDNTHRAVLSLAPRYGLQEGSNLKIAQELAAVKKNFTAKELGDCLDNTKKLLEVQSKADSREMLDKIPLLERGDINRAAEEIKYSLENKDEVDFLYLPAFTDKIAYVNLYFDARGLPEELVPFAHLLKTLLGRIATEKYGYAELAKTINAHTGGLAFNVRTFPAAGGADEYSPKFVVSGKAFVRDIDKLCGIMAEILLNSVFSDEKRLWELIGECKAVWDAEFFARGQSIVTERLVSYFSLAGKYSEQGFLSYYRFLNLLLQEDIKKIQEKLQATAGILFARNGLLVAYCCGESDRAAVFAQTSLAFSPLKAQIYEKQKYSFAQKTKNEGIIVSAQVQYVAAGGNFARHGYRYGGAMRVLENIMRYDYLWNKIRVKGGAYGANARFDYNGSAVFNSYRDPNLADTLAVFKEMPLYIEKFSPDEREMRKYVIGAISNLDKPLSVSLRLERAVEYYLRGLDLKMRQKERDEILGCAAAEIRALAEPVRALLADNYLCVLGGEEKIMAAKDVFAAIVNAVS
ncbi:MAG: insulinase family protein [Acidaminococcales bacterium]|nr:insulinase family protein [Acidaminococcales bacterium]